MSDKGESVRETPLGELEAAAGARSTQTLSIVVASDDVDGLAQPIRTPTSTLGGEAEGDDSGSCSNVISAESRSASRKRAHEDETELGDLVDTLSTTGVETSDKVPHLKKKQRMESGNSGLETNPTTVVSSQPILATAAFSDAAELVGGESTLDVSLSESIGRQNKRVRLDAETSSGDTRAITAIDTARAQQTSSESKSRNASPFLTLPLELLSEVLILTGSPRHVLAVARTCKALCHTLLAQDVQFIWRQARRGAQCVFEVEEGIQNIHQTINWIVNPIGPPPPNAGVIGAGGIFVQGNVDDLLRVKNKRTVALADPPKTFSEAAYAAFLFDESPCIHCGKLTGAPYESFALRVRKCKTPTCKFPTTFTQMRGDPLHQMLRLILPVNESGNFGLRHRQDTYWPYSNGHTAIFFNKNEAEAASAEYLEKHNDEAYKKKFELLKARQSEWMEFCVALHKWKVLRQSRYQEVKQINEKLTKLYADKFGWNQDDLLSATVFGTYQRHKTKLLETMFEADIVVMQDKIESQLVSVYEKRGRRDTEISLMKNRKDVELLYNRLRSAKSPPEFLPSLPTFRKLPVVNLLQSADHEHPQAKPNVANTLQKNSTMKELLDKQLKQWGDCAKQDLAVILGFPKSWKVASKNVLHPVERVTARFLCVRCERVEAKYRMDGCLDFSGACRHECFVGNERKARLRAGKKAQWEASNFVKDEKAINALKKSLSELGYAEDREAGNYMLRVGLAAICTSCNPPMVIDSRSIVGHSHRHDDMQLSFPRSVESFSSYLGGYPYEYGLVEKLTQSGASLSPGKKREIDKKNFGCRRCLREKQVDNVTVTRVPVDGAEGPVVVQVAAPAINDSGWVDLSTVGHRMHDLMVEGPREKPPPLFSFNGLRSHMKAKHGIEDIRDEDVLCYEIVPL